MACTNFTNLLCSIYIFFQIQKISFLSFLAKKFPGCVWLPKISKFFKTRLKNFRRFAAIFQNILCFFPDFKNFLPVLNPKRKNPGFFPFLAENFPGKLYDITTEKKTIHRRQPVGPLSKASQRVFRTSEVCWKQFFRKWYFFEKKIASQRSNFGFPKISSRCKDFREDQLSGQISWFWLIFRLSFGWNSRERSKIRKFPEIWFYPKSRFVSNHFPSRI